MVAVASKYIFSALSSIRFADNLPVDFVVDPSNPIAKM